MATSTPLIEMHRREEAPLLAYGPPTAGIFLVDRFRPIELEYAALRRASVILDLPNRGVVEVRGDDRLDFLGRMLTQRLEGQAPGSMRRSFWLNRKGRIDADLRVVELGDSTLLEADALAASRVVESLDAFVIADDVTLDDATERTHRLSIHGPAGPSVVGEAGATDLADLGPGDARTIAIQGHDVILWREDTTGDPGLELIMDVDAAPEVYLELLSRAGAFEEVDREGPDPVSRARLIPAGWHAYNAARIEGGTPLYMVDFGPDTLPHESGVVRDRIDFRKGCYLGQEVVARMDARGAWKQEIVGLRVEGEAQPATGSAVRVGDGVVGAVTSSTVSPMLGSAIICFAMLKKTHAAPGTDVLVDAEGQLAQATVHDGLTFWAR